MNRKKLLALARANGYIGESDLAKVKAFLAGENIVPTDFEGKSYDLDKVWSTAETVVIGEKPEAEKKAADDDAIEIKGADAEAFKAFQKAQTKAARKDNPPAIITHKAGTGLAAVARKNYERKIIAGKSVFSDPDHAEHFGASIRLKLAEWNRIGDYAQKENDLEIVGKTTTTFNNTSAGILIPPEYVASLLYLTEQYGVARKLANVRPMSRDVMQQPRKTAIITMNHTGENATQTGQDNSYDMVELIARKVMGISTITNEVLEDSAINVADDLAMSYVEAYSIRQDQDYFLGDGTGTYGGHVGLANALPTSAYISGSGNAWSAITPGDLDKLPGTVENVNVARCGYVSSRQFFYQTIFSRDTATSQFKGLVGPPINGSDASYKGWQWWFSQVLPTTSASASKVAYFGDYQAGSMIGERRDLTIAQSEHVAFTTDAMTYRATARYAVNVHGDGRGSTYGPILCLKTT